LIQTAFLDSNTSKAFTYFSELIATPNFDNKTNLSDCIKMSSVEKANELGNKSLEYGLSYAESGIKKYALQFEKLSGDIFYCQLASELMKSSDPSFILDDLIVNLTEIASHVFTEQNIEISVTGDKKNFTLIEAEIQLFLNALKMNNSRYLEKTSPVIIEPFKTSYFKTFFKTPMNVNNCVESCEGPSYFDNNYGTAIVLSSLLTHNYLLHYIREKGGAYGASARASENGVFSFTSF
jgi:presequence protease